MTHGIVSQEQLDWEQTCPVDITSDVIWKLDAYRAAHYLLHVACLDCLNAPAPTDIMSQLVRAAGSVSANLGEGYSRSSRADRLRFFTYALGSTRECVTWYQAIRANLPGDIPEERLHLLTRLRSLLLGIIRSARSTATLKATFER